jgi:hypothetical protein
MGYSGGGGMWQAQAEKRREHDYEWEVEQRLQRQHDALMARKKRPATDKQIALFRKLAATRTTTAVDKNGGAWQPAIDRVALRLANDENYRPRDLWVSHVIGLLKGEESAPKVGVAAEVVAQAAPVAPQGDPATEKQVNFVKVLLRKHEVTEDILAKVDEALLTKAGASQLIGLLKSLPEKA